MKEGEGEGGRKSSEEEEEREKREDGDFGIMHVVQNNGIYMQKISFCATYMQTAQN